MTNKRSDAEQNSPIPLLSSQWSLPSPQFQGSLPKYTKLNWPHLLCVWVRKVKNLFVFLILWLQPNEIRIHSPHEITVFCQIPFSHGAGKEIHLQKVYFRVLFSAVNCTVYISSFPPFLICSTATFLLSVTHDFQMFSAHLFPISAAVSSHLLLPLSFLSIPFHLLPSFLLHRFFSSLLNSHLLRLARL